MDACTKEIMGAQGKLVKDRTREGRNVEGKGGPTPFQQGIDENPYGRQFKYAVLIEEDENILPRGEREEEPVVSVVGGSALSHAGARPNNRKRNAQMYK